MNYSVVIVAAGSGSRMGLGYNKMLYTLKNGETILEKTIRNFEEDKRCTQIIVVTSSDDRTQFEEILQGKEISFVTGGETRQDSVYHGLSLVKEAYVMIHDGARPWVSLDCLNRLLDSLQHHDACLLMMPVKDTIKEVIEGKVVQTYQRSNLRMAQTPQAFKTDALVCSYQKAMKDGIQATDDAQIVELCSNEIVYEVEGDYENIKVTTKEDIEGK